MAGKSPIEKVLSICYSALAAMLELTATLFVLAVNDMSAVEASDVL